MKPIRTAIIGTGFMGRAHLEAVRRTESVDAVAIAGRSVEAAQRIGAGFSIPTISTDDNDILRLPNAGRRTLDELREIVQCYREANTEDWS